MSDPATDAVVTLSNVSVAYGKQFALREVTAAFTPGAVGRLGFRESRNPPGCDRPG